MSDSLISYPGYGAFSYPAQGGHVKTKKILTLIYVAAMTIWWSRIVLLSQSDFPFRAEPVYPDNQIEANAGYFYVTAQPGDEQTLTVLIANTGAQTQQVNVESASCYTSPYGDLIFVSKNDSPLMGLEDERFMLEKEMVLPESRFDLKAGQSRGYSFKIRAPDKVTGEVLGAVRFSVTQKGEGSGKTGRGFNLNVRRAITLIIRLQMSTSAPQPSPSILLGQAGWMEDQNLLYATLSNAWTAINRNARGTLTLKDGNSKSLVSQRFDLIKMAPRSRVRLPVDTGSVSLNEGHFTVELQLDETGSAAQESAFILDETLEIPDETGVPQAPPNLGKGPEAWFIAYGGWILSMMILLFILIFFIVARRRKNA